MFFTLIIPAYNCEETIDRLMQSIVNQHFDDLKIIIIDDSDEKHPNLYENYIKSYQKKLLIDYFPRRSELYTCHCPGNTRHDGLRRALLEDTEYIYFADCDDQFENDTLSTIYQYLTNTYNYPEVLLTPFYAWSENTKQIISLEKYNIGWLHGKFYKKTFLKENKIQFKIDLTTHEDVYFNTLVNSFLLKNNTDFTITEYIVYKWYHRDFSESHYEMSLTGQNFLEANYNDFLDAVISPLCLVQKLDNHLDRKYDNRVVNNLVTGYLYLQGLIYNRKYKYLSDNYKSYKKHFLQVMQIFGFSKEAIISIAYSQVDIYNLSREECRKGVGNFIEVQSFKDFVQDINFYI